MQYPGLSDLAMAVDNSAPTNFVHVLFASGSSGSLALTYRKNDASFSPGVSENPGTVPVSCDQASHVSLATDSSGDPHITYLCENLSNVCYLYYATKTGATLSTHTSIATVVASGCGLGTLSTLAKARIVVDSNGKAHVTVVEDSGSLEYLTNTTGSWTSTTVDISVSQTLGTAITVDADDNPAIAYGKSGNLYIGSKNSGLWESSDSGLSDLLGVGDLTAE